LIDHLEQGGRAVVVDHGQVWLQQGTNRTRLAELETLLPAKFASSGFVVDNVLAAVAACWHLQVSHASIVEGLKSAWQCSSLQKRLHVEQRGQQSVIRCAAVNLVGLHRLIDWIDVEFPTTREDRTIVYQVPPRRRAADYRAIAEYLSDKFAQVILVKPAKPAKGTDPTNEMKSIVTGKGSRCEVLNSFDEAAQTAMSSGKNSSEGLIVLARCLEYR
jgi:cyanophycin synthetase